MSLTFVIGLVLLVFGVSANATLIDRGGGLIYDDVLDITWLQDANYAATELTDARRDEIINAVGNVDGHILTENDFTKDASGNYTGRMTWWGAVAWAQELSFGGFDGWRLPTVDPVNGVSFPIPRTNNATTDRSYAKTTTDGTDGGWRDGAGNPVSEMGHMYYVNLGNLVFCTPNDADPSDCSPQTGFGLNNTSFTDGLSGDIVSFLNIQTVSYWSSSEPWSFFFGSGLQGPIANKYQDPFSWAVRDGDVSAVPEPTTLALAGIAYRLRRKLAH